MKLFRFILSIVLGVCFLFVSDGNAKAQTPTPCAAGEALKSKRRYEKAIEVYVAVFTANPQADCAIQGIIEAGDAMNLLDTTAKAQKSSCLGAQKLFELGLYDDAKAAYIELLKPETRPQCAFDGIKQVADATINSDVACTAANLLRRANRFDDAKTAYIALLGKNPKLTCANTGLAAIATDDIEYRLATIETLAGLGLFGDATEQMKLLLKQYPDPIKQYDEQNKTNRVEKLNYLVGGNAGWWVSFRRFLEEHGKPFWEFTLFALPIMVGFAIGFPLLRDRLIPAVAAAWEQPIQIDIQDFDVGAIELTISKGVTAMVEGHYRTLAMDSEQSTKSLVASLPDALASPAEIAGLPAQVNIANQLLKWLIPTRIITLSGFLQKAGPDGVGITLSLVEGRSQRVIDNRTIWQREIDPKFNEKTIEVKAPLPKFNEKKTEVKPPHPSVYYALAKYAASWAYYRFTEYIFCPNPERDGTTEEQRYRLLEKGEWESNLFFRDGREWQEKENLQKAQIMYLKALAANPKNQGASVNLGIVEIELAAADENPERQKDQYERARERLAGAIDTAKEPDGRSKDNGKIETHERADWWYVGMFQLAAVLDYQGKSDEAETKAKDLVKTIQNAEREIKAHLHDDRLVELVIKARHLLLNQWQEYRNERELFKNLETFLARLKPDAIILYATILRKNGKTSKNGGIETEFEDLKADGQSPYAFACYYAAGQIREEDANTALEYLAEALKKGYSARWANIDPSLKSLKEHTNKEISERFEGLIDRFTSTEKDEAVIKFPLPLEMPN